MARPRKISNADILAVARDEFLKHGVFGSTKEIARRAGLSEAGLFKRFSTKAQLFIAAMAPPTPGIEGIIERAAKTNSARKALHILSDGILDYFRVALPMIIPLVSHPSFTATDLPKNFDTSAATGLMQAVAHYLKDEQARGRIALPSPQAAAANLIAALHSIALFEIMGFHGGVMPQAGVHAMVDALWHGLDPARNKNVRKEARS